MGTRNPFSPSFGTSPPVLAGRDAILDSMGDALATGPTHPDYTALFIGVRGPRQDGDAQRRRGPRPQPRMAGAVRQRFVSRAPRSSHPRGIRSPRRDRTCGAQAAPQQPHSSGDRRLSSRPSQRPEPSTTSGGALSGLGDALAERETGLLITIDEMQSGDVDEIREFGSVLQHVSRREERPVAFVGAALPQIEDTLLSDDAITFLQRCSRYDIDQLSPQATRRALAEPISEHGRSVDAAAVDRAVAATSGYAFMIQLVGFHSWQAEVASPHITPEHVATGIAEAQRRIGRMVLAPTWRTLSDVDQQFLLAIAQDDGESKLADIADRLGVTANYAGVYRHRLIRAGMIRPAGRGRVTLAHHAARDWLREQDLQ